MSDLLIALRLWDLSGSSSLTFSALAFSASKAYFFL